MVMNSIGEAPIIRPPEEEGKPNAGTRRKHLRWSPPWRNRGKLTNKESERLD
jgi:hypothetical protein